MNKKNGEQASQSIVFGEVDYLVLGKKDMTKQMYLLELVSFASNAKWNVVD